MSQLFQQTFSKMEEDYIRNNYSEKRYLEITEYLNSNSDVQRTEKQVRRKARYLGLSKINTTINKGYFKNIDTESKAYWLGFIYADGWIHESKTGSELGIQLKSTDYQHLEKFNCDLCANVEISFGEKIIVITNNPLPSYTKYCKIRIHSKEIVRDLIKHNIFHDKTYNPSFPIIEDDKLFLHFIRGFLDGDGCISFSKGKNLAVKFIGANLKFFIYIKERFEKMGIICNIHTSTPTRNDLYINGDKKAFLDLLYKDSSVYLDRKYSLYLKAVSNSNI